MAGIIAFSSLWRIGFREWKGAGRRAGVLLTLAFFCSTVIVGYGIRNFWICLAPGPAEVEFG